MLIFFPNIFNVNFVWIIKATKKGQPLKRYLISVISTKLGKGLLTSDKIENDCEGNKLGFFGLGLKSFFNSYSVY